MERIYKLLLWLSPREFRERFADEIMVTARDVSREQRSPIQHLRAIVDAISTVAALHADFRAEARAIPKHETASSMDSLIRDIRFAARGLRREPMFTLFVVITLALGIGANATMYGIADKLLLRGPEHIRDADRVVRLFRIERPTGMNEIRTSGFGHVAFDVLRNGTSVFEGIAQYTVNDRVAGRGNEARSARIGYAGADMFPLLGVQPVLGRFIAPNEDIPNATEHVAVLSYAKWKSDFGGRSDALGKSVVVDDESFVVVGVAPRGLTGPVLGRVDYLVPATLQGPR